MDILEYEPRFNRKAFREWLLGAGSQLTFKRRSNDSCPLAKYLLALDHVEVEVDNDTISCDVVISTDYDEDYGEFLNEEKASFPTPPCAQAFIGLVDEEGVMRELQSPSEMTAAEAIAILDSIPE